MKIVDKDTVCCNSFFKDAQKVEELQDSEQLPYLTFPLQVETLKSGMLEVTDTTLLMMMKQKLSGLVQS